MNIFTISNYLCYEKALYDGKFSTVYRGYKINNRSIPLVIKKIKKHIHKKYVKEEIAIMKCLTHKNVLTLHEGLYHKKKLYLVLEYCNSGNILQYIRSSDHTYDQSYITQIIEGMKYLYKQNIIHRDIKPENILIHDHIIKICDFGLSKSMYLNNIQNSICGSPNYIAPELFTNKKYSRKSDIWSLGIILYEIIYKTHPYPNILNKDFTDFKFNYNTISQTSNIYNLIENMLVVNEELRMNWSDLLEYTLVFDHIQKPIRLHTSEPINMSTAQPICRNRSNSMFEPTIDSLTIQSTHTEPVSYYSNKKDSHTAAQKKSIEYTYSSSAPVMQLSKSVHEDYIDSQLDSDTTKMIKISSSTDLNYHDIIGESPESNQESYFGYYYNKLFTSKK